MNELENLLGRNVTHIYMNEEFLAFVIDGGKFEIYTVEGECCSQSWFHDFHGVDKLIDNGVVVEVGRIELEEGEFEDREDELIRFYGYKIITEHPVWGEQTSVFSFRNKSNGYYGGRLLYYGNRKNTKLHKLFHPHDELIEDVFIGS